MSKSGTGSITVSGASLRIPNQEGAVLITLEQIFIGAPATVSVTIRGAMRGGTLDAVVDTNTTATPTIRKVTLLESYDYFLVAATWTGGANVSLTVNWKT